jgi:DNA-binding LacI/PurR family transcriptional regulator
VTCRCSLANKALDYLASRGRRRLAVVGISAQSREYDEFLSAAAARGMVVRPYWVQCAGSGDGAVWARRCVHLLMNPNQTERPDALFIADDNLVEYALPGLLDAGIKIPDDLEVVAHCNFPWPTPGVLPIKRLGFDSCHVWRTCIDLIDRQRRGESVPPVTGVPALFEEEIA